VASAEHKDGGKSDDGAEFVPSLLLPAELLYVHVDLLHVSSSCEPEKIEFRRSAVYFQLQFG
jgi:hypothetical protein